MNPELLLPNPRNWFTIERNLQITYHKRMTIKWEDVRVFDYVPIIDRRVLNIVKQHWTNTRDLSVGKLFLKKYDDGSKFPEWETVTSMRVLDTTSVEIIREFCYETS